MGELFFPISKLAWLVLAPSHLILWLVLAAAIASLFRRERLTRRLVVAAAWAFVIFGLLPAGAWLARPLENRYPRPAAVPAHVDGILNLGGGLETRVLQTRHAPGSNTTEPRLVGAFELARLHPEAKVVFTGGWGPFADAIAARYVFGQLGLDPARLVLEDRARNTYENFTFSRDLVHPKPGEVWVLATSAIQMPRAMAVARRMGWTVIPWPTDYVTSPTPKPVSLQLDLNIAGNLALLDAATHEWVGLAAYGADGLSGAPPSAAAASANAAVAPRS